MDLKQRLVEGILVGVVGGLVATAIGGVGILAYNEMKESKEQLVKTTIATNQLNSSSIASIDNISTLVDRVNKLEEQIKILSEVGAANRTALNLHSNALKNVTFSNTLESSNKIRQAERVTVESSKSLKQLPKLISDRDLVRAQQQKQIIQLNNYRDLQQQRQQQR